MRDMRRTALAKASSHRPAMRRRKIMNRNHAVRAASVADSASSLGSGFSSATRTELAPMQGGHLFQTRYRSDWEQRHFVGGYSASV
jgi:hypothetical protein